MDRLKGFEEHRFVGDKASGRSTGRRAGPVAGAVEAGNARPTSWGREAARGKRAAAAAAAEDGDRYRAGGGDRDETWREGSEEVG